MALEIRMPQIASDMTEADVVSWLVAPGEPVSKGDLLLEIETEKSTVEIEAPASGTLLEILVPAGSTDVAVDTLLATLEPADEASAEPDAAPTGTASEAEAEAEAETEVHATRQPGATATSAAAAPTPKDAPPTPGQSPARARGPIGESPVGAAIAATALARRVADQAGVDLTGVTGTGPRGRITRGDVEQRVSTRAAFTGPGVRTLSPLELTARCRIDALVEALGRLNTVTGRPAIEPLHVVVRAAALALREVPEASATAVDEAPAADRGVEVAVSVTVDGRLALPIVRDADAKGLGSLAREIADLAERARGAGLTAADLAGGDLAVVDLGTVGIDGVRLASGAPADCVIGLGAARSEPVVEDGQVVPGTTLLLTLTADRESVPEAAAARFLAAVRRRLEWPVTMVL